MYDTCLKRKWDNEAVMEYARQESKAEGKAEVVRNLIDKFGFNDQQAGSAAGVSEDFVKKVRASLKEK